MTWSGVVSHMVPVLFMTHASAKALVAFPLLGPHICFGHSSRTIGIVS